jgi:uncharacterized protein (TIGR02246 family)
LASDTDGTWRADTEAQVRRTFARYEQALRAHAVETLNELFLPSPDAVRFGVGEENYGHDAIAAYRRLSAPVHPQRQLRRTIVAVLSPEVACVSTEFTDPATLGLGRQTQTWLRTADGWRIAMAHVSVRPPGGLD